jgi:hypothetical protein
LCRLRLKILGLAGTAFFALLGLKLERRGEANLPTKQACAQAPAWISCPDVDRWRPQGDRVAARSRPQAAVRVNPSGVVQEFSVLLFDAPGKHRKAKGSLLSIGVAETYSRRFAALVHGWDRGKAWEAAAKRRPAA